MRCVQLLIIVLALAGPASAREGEGYDPREAGHPLRMAAYLLHPVGVFLDRAIYRPAWRLGQKEGIWQWVGATQALEAKVPGPSTNPFLEPYSEEQY